MKAMAILMFLFGIYIMLGPAKDDSLERAMDRVVATNFVTYRNAAFRYVYTHKDETGEIAKEKLSLPLGWNNIRDWHTRIYDDKCFIYGNVSLTEVNAIKEIFKNSFALGFAKNGKLLNIKENQTIDLPGDIPDGYVVSVSNLD